MEEVARNHDGLLPEFPNAGNLNLPNSKIRDKVGLDPSLVLFIFPQYMDIHFPLYTQ